MRSIERAMIHAAQEHIADLRGRWRRGNTSIARGRVYLHGNVIATLPMNGTSFTVSLAGHGTNTTRSRVNALLQEFGPDRCGVFQRDHAQYFRRGAFRRLIDTNEWITPEDEPAIAMTTLAPIEHSDPQADLFT